MTQESISYQFLYKTFLEYFRDEKQAEQLLLYIKEKRKKEPKCVLVRNILKEK